MRLRVGVLGAEQLARVLGGERLDGVDVLAAGVEAVTDGALGVLVAEPGAHRQQDGGGRVVLARDQLQRGPLVGEFGPGGVGDAGSTVAITSSAALVGGAGGGSEVSVVEARWAGRSGSCRTA